MKNVLQGNPRMSLKRGTQAVGFTPPSRRVAKSGGHLAAKAPQIGGTERKDANIDLMPTKSDKNACN